MAITSADTDVVVIGAGAAGLAAAKELRRLGVDFRLLEASHRIGGRAYTEQVGPGLPFDLGCHWLHSGSLNPFAKIADQLGITYTKEGFSRMFFQEGRWSDEADLADWNDFLERQNAALAGVAETGTDCSYWEATGREDRWTPFYDYIASLSSSHDADEISVLDALAYRDTEENWPVKDGYGTLIAAFGADVPVSLNTAVTKVDWSGPGVTLTTARGGLSAQAVLVTVSTAILAAEDIRFTPSLPVWKQEAIAALPLGNHNRICLTFEAEIFDPDLPRGFIVKAGEGEPMSFRVCPFGFDYAVGLTGGRFADWLERAGMAAAVDFATEKLVAVFGSGIAKRITGHRVTAWRGDPWIKGAYACARPGQAHQRARLAEPLEGKIFFAGEATSAEFFSTAHGAYLSGINAARRLASVTTGRTDLDGIGKEQEHA